MAFTIFVVTFVFVACSQRVYEILFMYKKSEAGEIFARWTIFALAVAYGMFCCSAIAEYFLVSRKINFIITALGVGIYFICLIIRYWAIKSLGKFRSIHIEIRKTHEVIKQGPYKYVRHPIYIEMIFESLSIPLALNSFYTILLVILTYIPLVILRAYMEDRKMLKKLGERYHRYCKQTGAFIPVKRSIRE